MFARILVVIAFASITSTCVYAQDIVFEQVGDRDGLNYTITSIAQDTLGYLWFGSNNGLFRYDGYSFKMYQYDPADSTSLSSVFVESVYVDSSGRLWVGTVNGLSQFDPLTDSFVKYPLSSMEEDNLFSHKVYAIYEPPSEPGILWVGTTEGLTRFDVANNTVTNFRHDPLDPESLSFRIARSIFEDSYGVLWVGTGDYENIPIDAGGLNRFNRETQSFVRYRNEPGNPQSLKDNRVRTVYEDSRGTLWVGTKGDGLHQYDRAKDSFIRHNYGGNHPEKPSRPHLLSGETNSYVGVSFVFEDSREKLWIGGIWGGLNLYDPATSKQIHFESDIPQEGSLQGNGIWTMFEDQQGVLWLGTWNGLYKVIQRRLPVTTHSLDNAVLSHRYLTGISEDDSGTIWVGSSGRWFQDEFQGTLATLDPGTNDMELFVPRSATEEGLSSDKAYHIGQDSQGKVWVSTLGGGVNKYLKDSNKFIPYRYDRHDPHSIPSDTVYWMMEDKQNTLWFGTRRGLARYDEKKNHFYRYQHDPDDPSSISSNRLIDFGGVEDRFGNVWFGTMGDGLNLFDRKTNSFKRFLTDTIGYTEPVLDKTEQLWVIKFLAGQELVDKPATLFRYDADSKTFTSYLPGERVNNYYFSEDGSIWIGTLSGLVHFDSNTETYIRYTSENGLAHNRVENITEDDSGNIWVATRGGLSKFSTHTQKFTNYYEEDGLPVKEFNFPVLKASDGTFYYVLRRTYVGGGFISFHPDQVIVNDIPPEIVFSDFEIENRVAPGEAPGALRGEINLSRELTLKPDETAFSIEFAGIHNAAPEKNTYRYILEGYDEAWIESGTVRTARYSKLSPGDYTFKVEAANNEGIWTTEPATIDIRVLPPWWRTTFAFIVYGLLFVVGVIGIDRFQRRRLISKERLRAEREKAQAIASTNTELERALKHLTETQDQLIHTEKMASLGQLTAGVAHEIKNPLNFINNFAMICAGQAEEIQEVLEKEKSHLSTESAHELKEILDDLKVNASKINEHGHRADGIIRSMLEHSRSEAGEKRPVDINKLLDEYVNLSYHAVRARTDGDEVAITRDYAGDLPEVSLVPQEIGRVFINLLDNAFYAIKEKTEVRSPKSEGSGSVYEVKNPSHVAHRTSDFSPEVKVTTSQTNKGVEVRIADNGTGIPGEILSKIFEPFFTTKPTGSGTGLGLSLSYDIVTQGHGGSLSVESEEGEGAVFVISLPV